MRKQIPLGRTFDQMRSMVEPLRKLPLAELTGEERLLIENHSGVTKYSVEQICVAVSYGQLSVSGNCLQLACVTKDRLLITGKIDQILLCRR